MTFGITVAGNGSTYLNVRDYTNNNEVLFGISTGSGGALLSTQTSIPLILSTLGAERMRITTAGNVGIGTTTPWGKLSITGSGTGTGLAFAVADSANTPRFSVLDNGKIGIGTTTPQANLHIVQGGATDAILSIEQNVSGTNDPLLRFIIPTTANTWVMGTDNSDSDKFKIARNAILDGTREYWTLDTSGNIGIGTTTPQQKLAVSSSGDTRLVIDSSGSGSQSIVSFQNQGVAKFEIKNQPSGGSQFLSIGRYGANDLNVDNNGNVGIGTTTPDNLLTLNAADNGALTIKRTGVAKVYLGDSGSNNSGDLLLYDSSGTLKTFLSAGTNSYILTNKLGIGSATAPGSTFSVYGNQSIGSTYGATAAPTNGLIVEGNVGIGTTTPGALLSTNGTAIFGGVGAPTTLHTGFNPANIAFAEIGKGSSATGISTGFAGLSLTTSRAYTDETNAAIGALYFTNTAISANEKRVAQIHAQLSGSTDSGALLFLTNSAGTFGERMRITPSGNVGVGTTSPSGKLAVEGSGGSGVDVLFKNSGGNLRLNLIAEASSADINFGDNASYVGNGRIRYDNSTNDLSFMTNGGERFRITAAGNVGIGTTTPGAKLHVLESSGEGNPAISPGEILRLQRNSASNSTAGMFIIGGTQATNYIFLGSANGYSAGGTLTYNNASDFLTLGTAGAEKLRITSAGNIGIGTTSPRGKLEVAEAVDSAMYTSRPSANVLGFNFADSSNQVLRSRFIGYDHQFFTSASTIAAGTEAMRVDVSGRIGIGTTTPTAQLSTTGTVRFAALGSAGANLVTDALGNVTASSDERLKDKQGDFVRGLAAINAISPVLYKWRPETGFDTQSTYAGFFAQNVQAAIPEAVSQDSRGHLTLADRPILAALVNAVKELAQRFSDLAERITTKELVAVNGDLRRVAAEEICAKDSAGETCITRSQLVALLAAAGQTAGSPSTNAPTTDASQAPVLELNGNASSTIEVGDTYNDLGARIVAPTSDLNLGIIIVLDGATTTQVSIDTSAPGEHTVLYTVTSPTTGLTSSIMRTVTVSPAAQLPVPVVEDNPFTSQPADDSSIHTTTSLAIPAAA